VDEKPGILGNPVVVSVPTREFEFWGNTTDSTSSSVYKQQQIVVQVFRQDGKYIKPMVVQQ